MELHNQLLIATSEGLQKYIHIMHARFAADIKTLTNISGILDQRVNSTMSSREREIAHNTICPHCKTQTTYLHDSTILYGIDQGPIYYCPCKPGGVYVGCHKSKPTVPLGFPADKYLRDYRRRAHVKFDRIWSKCAEKLAVDFDEVDTPYIRSLAYQILTYLIDPESPTQIHIGNSGVAGCRKIIKVCNSGDIDRYLDTFAMVNRIEKLCRDESNPITCKFEGWLQLNFNSIKESYTPPGSNKKKKRRKRK